MACEHFFAPAADPWKLSQFRPELKSDRLKLFLAIAQRLWYIISTGGREIDRSRKPRLYDRVVIDSGRIYDLSEGGVYVKTTEPKRLGTLVGLEIRLFNSKQPLVVCGRVIRIIYKQGGKKNLPPGMAIVFETLSEPDRELIRAYVEHKKSGGV